MLVLVGFMGAGKSTVGKKVARRLGVPFVDSDQVIETSTGRTCGEIITGDGEPRFREIEAHVISELLNGETGVLAVGGGAVTTPQVRAALRDHQVVYLKLPLQAVRRRVGNDSKRPLMKQDVDHRYAERLPLYRDVATVTVDAAASAGKVTKRVLVELGYDLHALGYRL